MLSQQPESYIQKTEVKCLPWPPAGPNLSCLLENILCISGPISCSCTGFTEQQLEVRDQGISPVNTFMVWRRRSPDTPRADVCTRSFLPVILDSLKVSLLPPLLSSGTCIRFPRYDTFFLGLMGENSRSFRWTKSLSKMVQSSCRAQSLEQKTYSPSFLILPSNHRCHELQHFNCDNTCK